MTTIIIQTVQFGLNQKILLGQPLIYKMKRDLGNNRPQMYYLFILKYCPV